MGGWRGREEAFGCGCEVGFGLRFTFVLEKRGTTQRLAHLRQSELGDDHVGISMASGNDPAEFEKQYEIYVCLDFRFLSVSSFPLFSSCLSPFSFSLPSPFSLHPLSLHPLSLPSPLSLSSLSTYLSPSIPKTFLRPTYVPTLTNIFPAKTGAGGYSYVNADRWDSLRNFLIFNT